MIKLYNSLTRSIEQLKTLEEGSVSLYSCGPTVYDSVTIGNLRAYITADTLNRVLDLASYKVRHTMNITDIDDKTIARSAADYPEDAPEIALKTLTNTYELSFMDDIAAVGNRVDRYKFIRASDSIELMQNLIKELIKGDFAYIADDGIYFSIDAYKKDGKKYGQLLDLNTSNTSQARINNDEYDKNYVHDFALWKLMKLNEPAWSFIIDGKDYLGRPGWHIECSAMSGTLGQPIDIHTGGVDLIFPHHENEIAQSTAGKKDPVYSNFFVHNEHLMIDNKKISKSLGNGYTLKDLAEKGYEPLSYRLFVLQSHYRTHSDFSWELIGAAQARLNRLRNFAALRWQAVDKPNTTKPTDFSEVREKIIKNVNDDLNTPKLLAEISSLQNRAESNPLGHNEIQKLTSLIQTIDQILGLDLMSVDDVEQVSKELLTARQTAREKKDWAKSDELRETLHKKGIGINDTDYGQIWYRLY